MLVTDTDTAGNSKNASVTFTLDKTLAQPTVALSNDSGSSNSDGLTNDASLTFSTAAADVTRTFTVDGGTPAASYTAPTSDGGHTVLVTDTDTAGNSKNASITFTLDKTLAQPTAALTSDSGSSDSDGITNDASLTFSTAAADVTRTFTVDGGTPAASYTAPTADGGHTVLVTDTDTAGNSKNASITFTLDKTAPAATASITGADDNVPADPVTNIAQGDTTNDNTPTLKGTITGTLNAGEVVAVYDGVARLGNATVNGSDWSFTSPGLSNGAHSFTARVEDAAGNMGTASAAYAFGIDATVPTTTATITSAIDDEPFHTGNVASGNLSNDAILVLSGAVNGTLGDGEVVHIFDGASFLGIATVSGNTWSFTTPEREEGAHSFTAVVENAGGNQGAPSAAYTVTVDTTAPAEPTVTPEDTSKIASGGHLYLNDDQFNVSGLEAGATWQYTLNGGTDWIAGTGGSFTLAEGTYGAEAQVRQIDAAGNPGTPNINDGEPVVVDTHVAVPTQTLAVDTGASNSDGITRNGMVNVSGLEAGAVWQYSTNGGSTWISGTGSSFTLGANSYAAGSVRVQQTDLAGNTSELGVNASDIVVDDMVPIFVSATVNGATLALNYDSQLDSSNPPVADDFTVVVSGVARGIAAVAVSGNSVTLTLANPVAHDDTVSIVYTDPSTNDDPAAIQDIAGNDAGGLGNFGLAGQGVQNNTPAGPDNTTPVLQTATINGATLTLTYNEPLDPDHQPSTSYYQVTLTDGTGRSVNNLAISGNSVTLTLSSPVANGLGVTLSYNDPSTGDDTYAIQDLAGNDAASLSSHAVTNNTPAGDVAGAPKLVSATFTETANASVTLTYSEAMQASNPGIAAIYVNGTGSNVLTGVSGIVGGAVTFTTNATLGATDYAVFSYHGGDLRDLGNINVGTGSIVIGGSGVSDINLDNADWSKLTTPIIIRGNGGADILVGTGNNDTLIGGGGADTLNGGWGADIINLNETTRASDTVVVGTDGGTSSGSQPYFYDTVHGFDVSNAGGTNNDKLDLPSSAIAGSTSGFVNGDDTGVIKSHSIGSGGIVTFGGTDAGAPILIDAGKLNDATAYLEKNFTTPGQAVAFNYDSDGNGYADSLFVFQDLGGTDIDNDVLIKLAGVTGVMLGTTAGQNVVQLVDTAGPDINGASIGTGANAGFSLTYIEPIQVTADQAAAGWTVLQNGAGANVITGASVSGANTLTFQTNANLASGDYLYFTYDPASGTVRDLTGNAAHSLLPGVALGGSGDSIIDLSSFGTAGYGIYDLGGNDTITGSDGGDDIGAGDGNDVIHAGAGNDYLEGGTGADTLDGGAGADEFGFTQGDSTTVVYSNGIYTFAGNAADVITGGFTQVASNGDSQTADRIHLRSAMPGSSLSLMPNSLVVALSTNPFTDGQAIDQGYFLTRGGYSAGTFTVASNGADTLVVYDGDNLTGGVSQTALVVQGVIPSQLTTTNWGDIYLSSAAPAVNHAPIITSNGGVDTANVSIPENTTAVTTVAASDADGDTSGYSIAGGADAAKFGINSGTGALYFLSAPDFENPTDSGANNVYDVIVQASDGHGGSDTQAIAVTVTDVAEGGGAPVDTTPPINTGANFSESAAVVGTWTLGASSDNAFITLVLLADGRFMYMEGSGNTPNGLEAGTYSYNATAGTLTFNVSSDFNGNGGIGPGLNGVALPVSVVNGELSITFAQGDVGVFDRQPVNASGIAGTWMMPVSANEPFSLLVLYADGRFMYGEGSGEEPNGMESGTYIYNPSTGTLGFTTLFDNNGDGGISDNGTSMSASATFLNNGTVQLVGNNNETFNITRQYPATVSAVFNENVMASNANGLNLSLNPSDANGWQGTALAITGAAISGATANFLTYGILNSTDVVRLQYNANAGNLRDLAGNPSPSGEVWIGGSGNSTIDLDWYRPWNGGTVILRGNGGADRLVGTDGNDVLVDGGGADSLTGSWGADIIRLVENGTSIGYARDVVKIGVGESPATGAGSENSAGTDIDVVLGSSTSPAGTGFDIASANTANHDVLGLTSANIAANSGFAAGTTNSETGAITQMNISGGIASFKNVGGQDVAIGMDNIYNAIRYLMANLTHNETSAFKVDTDGNGSVDSLLVFQDHGHSTLLNMDLPDTAVVLAGLIGIDSATLGTTAGANVVQIQDTQAPNPVATILTSDGFSLDFAESVHAPTGLALTLQVNGSGTVHTPASVSGDGTTSLTVHYAGVTLAATDWAMMHYAGTDASNSFTDAATTPNVLVEDAGGFSFAEGGSGNNTIDLHTLSNGYDIKGNAGNDTLIGSSGDDGIRGGTGADTMTGGAGSDDFNFEQGDSPVGVVNLNAGGTAGVLDNGDTFTFANGVDRITDLSSAEGISLDFELSDLFGNANAPGFMGQWTALGVDKTPPSNGLATDQGYFVVRGGYADGGTTGSSGTFTVDTTAGADTLIVWDGDSSNAVTQTGIVLSGVTPEQLNLYTGSSWISHV